MFLPAETADPAEVERHRMMFAAAPVVTDVLDGMLNFSLILNPQRQVVFVNKAFAGFLAEHGITEIIGRRPGNLYGCRHSAETPGGCGTTESCRFCGAGRAMAEAISGKASVKECRIMSGTPGEDLDLSVSVSPFTYSGEKFLIMSLMDISAGKRREVLEKIFFHDILNTAGGVQGLIALMMDCEPVEAKSYVPTAAKASERMIGQILSQRDLAAAERGELLLNISEVRAAEILNEVAALFRAHDAAKDKKIIVAGDCRELIIATDRTLLFRVIGNLVKNALEAEKPGAVITVSCLKTESGAAFLVHNPGIMPADSRLQVFQRSFSTKGAGRGLGTYSMRLLTEKYLKGKVSFTTGPAGTEFRAEYPSAIVT